MNSSVSLLNVRAEPVQQRSAARIENLLDAAAKLIDEHGINAVTTSNVATQSGSSVGVVYRYFPNIQSLLRALAARNMERFASRMSQLHTAEPAGWLSALDSSIDAYVELARNEPGFRAIRFGDVIDERFTGSVESNRGALAAMFTDLFVKKYHVHASEELSFDMEVLIEVSDAILHRAFLYDSRGDDRFIARLRVLIHELMAPHQSPLRPQ